MVEVPHFASLRDGEREISILRSEDGQTWKPHVQAASDSHQDVQELIKATTGGMAACQLVSARIIFNILLSSHKKQEAQLSLRDRASALSVEIW